MYLKKENVSNNVVKINLPISTKILKILNIIVIYKVVILLYWAENVFLMLQLLSIKIQTTCI